MKKRTVERHFLPKNMIWQCSENSWFSSTPVAELNSCLQPTAQQAGRNESMNARIIHSSMQQKLISLLITSYHYLP